MLYEDHNNKYIIYNFICDKYLDKIGSFFVTAVWKKVIYMQMTPINQEQFIFKLSKVITKIDTYIKIYKKSLISVLCIEKSIF